MDFNDTFAKPRKLVVPCILCTTSIPYDPFDINPTCSACTNKGSMSAQGETADSNITLMNPSAPSPNSFPINPSSSLKRRAEDAAKGEAPYKRVLTDDHQSSFNPPIHPSVSGSAAADYGGTIPLTDDDEEDDEFVDAPEEPVGDYTERASGVLSTDERAVDEEVVFLGASNQQGDGNIVDVGDRDTGMEEEDDLFNETFGRKDRVEESEDDDDESESDRDDSQSGEELEDEDEDQQDHHHGKSRGAEDSNEDDEDTQQSPPSLSSMAMTKKITTANLQPPPQRPPQPAIPSGPRPPNPATDLSPNLKRLLNFHSRARDLIPRLPLAPHRYWIGVLNPSPTTNTTSSSRTGPTFHSEKSFTWMKGNRLTTVRTIWHTYQTATATEDFVLLLGGVEKVGMRERMEELDYFGERKVIFRAVERGHPEVRRGGGLCGGVVTGVVGGGGGRGEVIEID